MTRRLLAGLACGLLLFVACADEDPAVEDPGTTADATESAAGEPTVTISSPADGSTIEAGDVEVTVSPANFEIVDKLGQAAVEGEGHVHYYIDVDEIPTTPGQPAVTADENTYHAAATTSYPWSSVEAGEHTFGVQLVNNDHTPLEPPVTAEVTVTVS
jgi:hypothetical protein